MAKAARYSKQLVHLTQSLERYGVDPAISAIMADGVVHRLLNWCWANLTDIIGDGAAVDKVVMLSILPPGVIARLAYRAGLLRYGVTGRTIYYMPHAYTERPDWVSLQWAKCRPMSYKRAMNRARSDGAKHLYDIVDAVLPDNDPLFGEARDDDEDRTRKGTGDTVLGYSQIIEYFTSRWREKVGGGNKYPFGGAMDGQCIKRILAGTDGLEHTMRVVDAYFDCKEPFYEGKTIRKLAFDLPRFVALAARRSGGGNGSGNEIPYSSTGGIRDLADDGEPDE